MSEVIDLDARRPHEVAKTRCRQCKAECISVHPVGTNTATLECLDCGARDSEVVDGPEPTPAPERAS